MHQMFLKVCLLYVCYLYFVPDKGINYFLISFFMTTMGKRTVAWWTPTDVFLFVKGRCLKFLLGVSMVCQRCLIYCSSPQNEDLTKKQTKLVEGYGGITGILLLPSSFTNITHQLDSSVKDVQTERKVNFKGRKDFT